MQPASNFLVARQSRNVSAGAMRGIGGASPPRVSISGNTFTLIDAAGNSRPHTIAMVNPQTQQLQEFVAPYLDCVLIGVNPHVSKVYYDTKYDPNGEDAPPACWSDNGVGPSSLAAKPQAQTCVTCPHNVWGSAVSQMTGKQTKACNDAKKIAILIPGDGVTYQFRIPPATLKNLKAYAQTVSGQQIGTPPHTRACDVSDIITRISFESQGVLKFEPVAFITEAVAAQMDEVTQDKLDALLGTHDQPFQGVIGQAPAQPAQALPAPAQPAPMPAQAPQQFVAPAQPMQPPQFVPAQAPVPAQPALLQGSPQMLAATAPAAPAAPRRGRRPKAEGVAPQTPAQPVQQAQNWPQPAATAPAFMQPPPAQAAAPAPQWTPPGVQAPAAAPPAPQFGMVPNAPAPGPDLAKAIDAAMNFGKS